jgi:hypothetical protein
MLDSNQSRSVKVGISSSSRAARISRTSHCASQRLRGVSGYDDARTVGGEQRTWGIVGGAPAEVVRVV